MTATTCKPAKPKPKAKPKAKPKDPLALYHTEQEWMDRFYAKTGLGALTNWYTFTSWKQKQMRKPKGKKR